MAEKSKPKKVRTLEDAPSSESLTIIDPHASDVLREQVEAQNPIDDGTIVTFEYTWQIGDDYENVKKSKRRYYTYAALWISGSWHVTGNNNSLPRNYDHAQFVKMLATPNVRRAAVATKFEGFKP
jgi:hypothetical protein